MVTAKDIGPQNNSEPDTELESRLSIQLARGVTRSMMQLGCTCLSEFTLRNSRRVDVIALDRKGLFTIIEVKTSVADFRSDQKWHEYLPFCDQYYFAVPEEFPADILPPDHGLLIADPYGAEIIRQATPGTMNASRRKALTLRFARKASSRLTEFIDPPLSKR
jgi:hypothetical protein